MNTAAVLACADLAAQQRALQAAVRGQAPRAEALLQGASAGLGLAVYQDAYQARLLSALRDNYEVLYRALGDDDFQTLGLAYLHAHPPCEPSLRWWGDRLADFMVGLLSAAAEDGPTGPTPVLPHPALIDLARMDWALRMAFDAADSPVLQAEHLQSLAGTDWPGLRLRLRPGVQLLSLDWAVGPAWRVLRSAATAASETGEPEAAGQAPLDAPEALSHVCLVWRPAQETRWRSLQGLEAQLLQALQAGRTFADLCEQAGQALGDEAGAAPAVVGFLQACLRDGLLLPLDAAAA